ncbi:DUF3159 domain-containing protein [Prauserella cavernicola]
MMTSGGGRIQGDLGDEAREPRNTGEQRKPAPALLDQVGGPSGLVYGGLPVIVFVVANSIVGLTPAIIAAIGFALVLGVWRLSRKEPAAQAFSGVFGVAVAGFVANQTGSAKGFFLIGIWTSLVIGVVLLLSVLVRWPLVGLVLNAVTGKGNTWRADKPSLRAYDIATLALTSVFAARFVVQQWLYDENSTGWLAFAKIAMGYPLFGLAFLVILWAARRSNKRLKALTPAP